MVFPFEFKCANFWIRSMCEPIENHDLNGIKVSPSVINDVFLFGDVDGGAIKLILNY